MFVSLMCLAAWRDTRRDEKSPPNNRHLPDNSALYSQKADKINRWIMLRIGRSVKKERDRR